jgi:transglutaminase/protease-like cytokinesis protein 3
MVQKKQRSSSVSRRRRAAFLPPAKHYSFLTQLHSKRSSWSTLAKKLPIAGLFLIGMYMLSFSMQSAWKEAGSSGSFFGNITYKDIKPGTEDISSRFSYEAIDRAAAGVVYQGESVSELALILKQYANSDADKARIIFTWITNNIAYDVPSFLSGQYGSVSPGDVLKERKSVCSGYANLFNALAHEMGLEAVVIEGYSKGLGYRWGEELKVNHAWNAVKVGSGWYLVDATWGAGYVNGNNFVPSFNPHYFATPPQVFVYDHLPVQENWQLLSQIVSKADFINLPSVSPQYFADAIQTVSHPKYLIESAGTTDIVLQAPGDVELMATLKTLAGTLDQNYVTLRQNGQYHYLRVVLPTKGQYELEVFSKRSLQQGPYGHAISYGLQFN